MMSNGKNVIESKCFNKILAHYDGIIEFNNQKNWNSSPGNQWWVIALRFFLKAFSWQNLNPIKKNQKSKCIFIENYTYIYFSLLILCSCKLLKHLEQLDSKALLLNPIVSSLPSCKSIICPLPRHQCTISHVAMAKRKKLQILMPTWRVYSFDKGYNFFLKFKFINLLLQEKKILLISYVFLIRGHFF